MSQDRQPDALAGTGGDVWLNSHLFKIEAMHDVMGPERRSSHLGNACAGPTHSCNLRLRNQIFLRKAIPLPLIDAWHDLQAALICTSLQIDTSGSVVSLSQAEFLFKVGGASNITTSAGEALGAHLAYQA